MADTGYLKAKVTGIVAPIGTILAFPNDFNSVLVSCDGQELPIEQYKELAEYFKDVFGRTNNFGGDGKKTFALPDIDGAYISVKDIKRYES